MCTETDRLTDISCLLFRTEYSKHQLCLFASLFMRVHLFAEIGKNIFTFGWKIQFLES